MVFKQDWEKADLFTEIDPTIINKIILQTVPEKTLSSFHIISGGCANINIKLTFVDDIPLILRLYIRDSKAAHIEQKITALIKNDIPVPEFIYVGNFENYYITLMHYMPGIPLRELILDHPDQDSASAVYDAGSKLALLQKYSFPTAGFFDENLKVHPFPSQNYVEITQNYLHDPKIIMTLGNGIIDKIANLIAKNEQFFPDDSNPCLVHGDYDPANILVDKIDGEWKVSAILDWEFAFSGSWLWDVSNMLRYSHKIPSTFKNSFIQGLNDTSVVMPDGWEITISLLNLLSLLDLLSRTTQEKQPNQYADIINLINHIMEVLAEE